jgi:hypothetical protein
MKFEKISFKLVFNSIGIKIRDINEREFGQASALLAIAAYDHKEN